MGRIKPVYYYERQAAEAKARADYYRNRQPSISTTVNTRRKTEKFYRSLTKQVGTDRVIYRVQVSDASLLLMTPAQAGLLDEITAAQVAFSLRGSGVQPSKANWYKGDATPVAQRTPYNTRWIRYYDTTGTQSHHSVPFSRANTLFTSTDLENAFSAFFSGDTKTNLLGQNNGRAYLTFEKASNAINT